MDLLTSSVLLVVALSAGVYALLLVLYHWALRRAHTEPHHRTAIRFSILKPLAGADDELDENLASFAALSHAKYEVLFGVTSLADAAVPAVRAFLARYPHVDARLIVTDPNAAENPKVAQLVGLERHARGDALVISDSNVRVSPDYLLHLAEALEEPGTHLVSTLVRGGGARSLGAHVENMILATHVAPSVAAGYMLTEKAITIGKSMAMWRAALRNVGGFRAVADRLAEDHALGQAFARAGLGVRVVPHFVENRNTTCSLARSHERHVRWAKLRRNMAPLGYLFEPLLWPVVVATLAAAVLQSPVGYVALAFALVLQGAGALLLRAEAGARPGPKDVLLEWFRSYFLFLCWIEGWLSRTVVWRGHHLRIGPETRILRPEEARPLPAPAEAHAA